MTDSATARFTWLLGDDVVLIDRTFTGQRCGSTSTSLVTLDAAGIRYQFNARPRDASGWFEVGGASPLPSAL